MNILNTIRSLFHRDQPSGPVLRNRVGGMAWVKPYGHDHGADANAGAAVRTVSLVQGDLWLIDPPQSYVVGPMDVLDTNTGTLVRAGTSVDVYALADRVLEPWRDIGDEERDESLRYLPPVPSLALPRIVKERT